MIYYHQKVNTKNTKPDTVLGNYSSVYLYKYKMNFVLIIESVFHRKFTKQFQITS